jgi:hypothetical protein
MADMNMQQWFRFSDEEVYLTVNNHKTSWVFEQVETPTNYANAIRKPLQQLQDNRRKTMVQKHIPGGFVSHWVLPSSTSLTSSNSSRSDLEYTHCMNNSKATSNSVVKRKNWNNIPATKPCISEERTYKKQVVEHDKQSHQQQELYRCMFDVLVGKEESAGIEKKYQSNRGRSKLRRISLPISDLIN